MIWLQREGVAGLYEAAEAVIISLNRVTDTRVLRKWKLTLSLLPAHYFTNIHNLHISDPS